MTLKLHRPTSDGGMEPAPVSPKDYRTQLRSRRWKPAEFANPESEKTNPWIAVAVILGLAVVTFALLVLGYGSKFW